MTNNGIRGPEAPAEGDGHRSQRFASLIGMLVAFATTFGSVGCGAPAGEPLEATEEQKTPEEANQAGRLAVLTPEAGLWPDMIVEFEPQPPDGARIVWDWHMCDHTIQNHNPDASHYDEPAEHPELIHISGEREAPELSAEVLERVRAIGFVPEEAAPDDLKSDLMNMNAVNYNAALDQIVMSVPRFNEIWVIDHSTSTEEAAGHTGGRWTSFFDRAAFEKERENAPRGS